MRTAYEVMFRKMGALCFVAAIGLLSACAAPSSYMGIALTPGASAPDVQALAARARDGDKRAQLELGIRFEEGRGGVAIDLAKAKQLYGLAAQDFSDAVRLDAGGQPDLARRNENLGAVTTDMRSEQIEANMRLALLDFSHVDVIKDKFKWPSALDVEQINLINPFVVFKYCSLSTKFDSASACLKRNDVYLLGQLLRLEEFFFNCEEKLSLDINDRRRIEKIYQCVHTETEFPYSYISEHNKQIMWMLWRYSIDKRDQAFKVNNQKYFQNYVSNVARHGPDFHKSYLADFILYLSQRHRKQGEIYFLPENWYYPMNWRFNCKSLLNSGMLSSRYTFEAFACEEISTLDK